jgi:hypothetical protein
VDSFVASIVPRQESYRLRSTPHSGLGVCVLLFALAGVVVTAIGVSETLPRAIMIAGVAIAIFLPLIYRSAKGKLDLFEPLVPSALAASVMFVGRPIADQALSSYLHLGYNIEPTFDWTLFSVLIGIMAFNLGYSSHLGRPLQKLFPNPATQFPIGMVTTGAITMSLLGAALFGVFLLSNGGARALLIIVSGRNHTAATFTRQSTGYLSEAINLLLPACLLFFGLWMRTRLMRNLFFAAVTGVPLFLYQASIGDRSELLPLIFGLPAVYYLWERRRPHLGRLLLAGLFLLFIFALLREVRNSAAVGRQHLQDSVILTDPGKALASTFTKDDSEMFDTFCNLVSVVPSSLPYHPFGLFTDISIRALPRILFPDKPLEWSDELIVTLWPQHYRLSRASSASSIFGNFYLYGGIPAVAFWSFLMGISFRQTWSWYLSHDNNLNAILLYSLVPSLAVVLWRGTVTGLLGHMFFTVVPLVLMQLFIRLRA